MSDSERRVCTCRRFAQDSQQQRISEADLWHGYRACVIEPAPRPRMADILRDLERTERRLTVVGRVS